MEIKDYLKNKKAIQKSILEYLNDESNTEENYQNLINILNEDQNIREYRSEFQEFLLLLSKISKHHQRTPDFISKITKTLLIYKAEIKQTFSNLELYKIFKNNKLILLSLIEEDIITPDRALANTVFQLKEEKPEFFFYFFSIFKKFYQKRKRQKIEEEMKRFTQDDEELFEQKIRKGENDHYICELIRNDSIDDFISHVNQKNISLSSQIEQSIFETNSYLLKNKTNLIEYSAFFGSSQIFKYLYLNGAELSPSLWLYSIHGENPEILKILEENKIQPKDETFIECFNESLKCHHNETAEFIRKNFIQNESEKVLLLHSKSVNYFNYLYFPTDLTNPDIFYQLCKHNYIKIVKFLLDNSKNLNVNKIVIFLMFF